jgi:hypothetical protein
MATVRLRLAENHLRTAQDEIEQALQTYPMSEVVAAGSEAAPLRALFDETTSLLENLQKVIKAREVS